jgi:hypothetical protein
MYVAPRMELIRRLFRGFVIGAIKCLGNLNTRQQSEKQPESVFHWEPETASFVP